MGEPHRGLPACVDVVLMLCCFAQFEIKHQNKGNEWCKKTVLKNGLLLKVAYASWTYRWWIVNDDNKVDIWHFEKNENSIY